MSAKRVKDDPESLPWLGRKLLFLDDIKTVERIVYGLYAVCGLLLVADFFYKRKYYVDVENWPGFYAFFGFFMCAGLVLGARSLRALVKRDESYYAPYDVEAEAFPEDQMERKENGDD